MKIQKKKTFALLLIALILSQGLMMACASANATETGEWSFLKDDLALTHEVQFVDLTDNASFTRAVQDGKTLTADQIPERGNHDGLTFLGWSSAQNGDPMELSALLGIKITAATVFTAQYSEDATAIRYVVQVDGKWITIGTSQLVENKSTRYAKTRPTYYAGKAFAMDSWRWARAGDEKNLIPANVNYGEKQNNYGSMDSTVTAGYGIKLNSLSGYHGPFVATPPGAGTPAGSFWTVTFVDDAGNVLKEQIVPSNGTATAPNDVRIAGKTLIGWEPALPGGVTPPIQGSVTYTAQFDAQRAVTVSANASGDLPFGTEIILTGHLDGFDPDAGITCQWQINRGSGWTDIEGANAIELTITLTEETERSDYRLCVSASTQGGGTNTSDVKLPSQN